MRQKTITTMILLVTVSCWCCAGVFSADGQFTDYYKQPIGEKGFYVHETRYDYSKVAKTITAGCTSDYQKIQAIYRWICANISYDTSYTIRTADDCFDTKKGVCQGYCELFYQISKAAGVATEIVVGKSKNSSGAIGREGHSWIFAYTRPSRGILLDPTWGAGSVDGQVFIRRKNCWSWFNVYPEWMLLSHFPDDASYQLVDRPMSLSEFISLPPVDCLWIDYGLDSRMLTEKVRSSQLEMPKFYNRGEGEFQIVDIPMRKSLKVGEEYTFRIKMNSERDFTIINNKVFTQKSRWTNEGCGIYAIRYMVRDVNKLKLSIWGDGDNKWWSMVEYEIEQPSRVNWEKVERHYPLSVPDAAEVKNLDAEEWEKAGVTGQQLLQLIRKSGTHELPILNSSKGQKLEIMSVPMNYTLRVGNTYTFRFKPLSGNNWALINGDVWHTEWNKLSDGTYEMTVKTTQSGYLLLSVQLQDGEPYWSCLEYEVR